MFGYLRFFLAFLVLLSHVGIKFYGLNPGVIAVVMFYILAGFVVSHLYMDILPDEKNKIVLFYKDRFLRIFPLYIYICILTTIFLLLTSFGNPNFTLTKLIYNITIVPLNYYMYIDSTILTNPSWWLIPPAWSLGTELQAYVLLPFALTYKRSTIPFATISFLVYIVANFSIINPDYFGYRFIIGVLYIFLIGSFIQQKRNNYPFLVWIVILFMLPIFYYADSFSPTYTKETFIGLLVGIPIVFLLSKTKIKLPLNHILGSLSYGLFLSHFLSIWILDYYDVEINNIYLYVVYVTLLSLCISLFGTIFVEKFANKLRFMKKTI